MINCTIGATDPLQPPHYVADDLSKRQRDGTDSTVGLSTVADAGVVGGCIDCLERTRTCYTCGES